MEKYYDEFVPNLIDSMLTNLNMSDSNLMMIKHYNTFDLSEEYVDEIAAKRERIRFMYHSFKPTVMHGAYEPFIDWLKILVDEVVEKPIDEFFDDCDVYPLHRTIFKSYFENGLCKRDEELLIGELAFESKTIHKEIIRMFVEIAKNQPLFFVLNRLHCAGSSTIEIIDELVTDKSCKNIAILTTYNEISSTFEYTKVYLENIINKFEENDCVLDWTFDSVALKTTDVSTSFKFNPNNLSDYYVKLNNMFYFLALEQADYYMDILYHKFEVEKVFIAPQYKLAFLELNARIKMYLDKTSDAMLYCNGMRNIIEESDDLNWKFKYYYIASKVHMYSYQQELALNYLSECEKIAKELDNPYFLFKIDLIRYMNESNGWRSIWLLPNDRVEQGNLLVEGCKKFNYLNHLAHVYVYSFGNNKDVFEDIDTIEQKQEMFARGIEVARALGNKQFLIEAYRKNVLIASINGHYDVANMFYEKCYELAIANNDAFEEASIYNGMGYNCCTIEKYAKANEYFNKALLIFIELNDMDAINETIYNMAINAVLAEDYAVADNYLTTNLRIIKIMKSNSVRVCNISKIYGLRAYCAYKQKILYNCKINLQYVEQFLGHIIEIEDMDATDAHLWDDDLFLYYFIGALMLEHENKLEEAYEKMCKAKKYVERSMGSGFFNITPYSIGFSRICRKLGREEEANDILLKCLQYCEERGYIYKKNQVKAELEHTKYKPIKWNLSCKGVTIESIIERANVEGMQRDHKEQMEEINFLSIWQKVINTPSKSIQRIIDNSITTLKNNYKIDELLFIRIEDNKPVIRYNDSRYDITKEKVEYLCEYFNINRGEFSITRLDKGYMEHKDMINHIFGFNSINTLICVPIFVNEKLSGLFVCCVTIDMDWNYKNKRYEYDENDLSILMMLFRQLMDAIDRMEAQNKIEKINNELQFANERLKEMAIKDNLTGLFNRQGFSEELETQFVRASEHKRKLEIALLYADLDNFKYYNDTFGHDVGDLILIGFSNIIQNICKDRGYAVRYGGDEFILVLYSNEREEIEEAAKSIYAKLKAHNGFEKEISEKLGKKVSIPPERHVSCSVGISDTVINPQDNPKDNMDETLKRADAMMYYVKKTTKHRYVFYGDVKEDVDNIVSGEIKKEKLNR